MTRALAAAVLLFAAPVVSAQVNLSHVAAGVQGCPELTAPSAGLGSLAPFFCDPLDRTSLDLPISRLSPLIQVRAGAFSLQQRSVLLQLAQGVIPQSQYSALNALLLQGAVLSIPQTALYRSLGAEAAIADAAGNPALAASLRAQAAALIAGKFDASNPDLLAARIDRDRLADLRAGVFTRATGTDTVSSYALGLGGDLSFAQLGGAPTVVDSDGHTVFAPELLVKGAYPFFVGPDGRANTTDDLPFVTTNPVALAAGYSLQPPISGTSEDRFDRINGSGVNAIAVYFSTAQIVVPSLDNPAVNKTVEVYGVYNPKWVALNGCGILGLGGSFNRPTGICTLGGNDVTAQALALGCGVLAQVGAGTAPGIGPNADGDCIELNTSAPAPALVQVEVLPLLGDPALRPAAAKLEPGDLTDLKLRGFPLPARPLSANGTTTFPNPVGGARRGVDTLTGAPLLSSGGTCRVRLNGSSVPIGPNGIAGDGDDVFPSNGACLLWGAADPNGAQHLQPGATVAGAHTANQTLFHTLCSASFDADGGTCLLDDLDAPEKFDALSAGLGGLGSFTFISPNSLLTGADTIRVVGSPLDSIKVAEQLGADFATFQLFAINPLSSSNLTAQDPGLNLQREQAGLLGCGADFASPCSRQQSSVWAADPAIVASVGVRRLGGIDLLDADATVLVQEFALEKALHANDLVGVAAGNYQPGVNFSRNGTFVTVTDPVSGLPVAIETGSTLPLTAANVLAMTPAQRASYQHGGPSKVQADGWVEQMPWATDPNALATFGAIVFQSDPNDPIGGPGNVFNPPGGEYCGRWMNTSTAGPPDDPMNSRTPFNETCTALETLSANYERLIMTGELVGRDHVFDPPESLAELVAMLDDDPSNDATGDPVAGPDGIFSNNQFVFRDDQMDFQVLALKNPAFSVQLFAAPADKTAARNFLLGFDPNVSCTAQPRCHLDVTATLSDPQDAHSTFPLVLALPIGYTVDQVIVSGPSDPNVPGSGTTVVGSSKVNLAALSLQDRTALLNLFAGNAISVGGQLLQMSKAEREGLFAQTDPQTSNIIDMDVDSVNDLDADRDGVWDGADDFSEHHGPVSDDEILCGSGIRGDKMLEDGIQYEPWRADEAPGSPAFLAAFPNGLPPRSPVFCRSIHQLLATIGVASDGTRRFVWHGASAPGAADTDADGFIDGLDNCPTVANSDQLDNDSDGVGNLCDNCVNVANPRVAADYLTANPWATLTGGQRDDDHDGFGNRCDAMFPGHPGVLVGATDLTYLRASNGRSRSTDTCGTAHVKPCAIFDLDEANTLIGPPDLAVFRTLNGKAPGPKCAACPLACTAGTAGTCGPLP